MSESSVKLGDPQGSVLGPILFTMFINDLSHRITSCHPTMFANDTSMAISEPSSHTNSFGGIYCSYE